MALTVSPAPACLAFVVADVSRTLMSVRATPVEMEPTAQIVSTATPAPVHLASVVSTVRSTPMTALTGTHLVTVLPCVPVFVIFVRIILYREVMFTLLFVSVFLQLLL